MPRYTNILLLYTCTHTRHVQREIAYYCEDGEGARIISRDDFVGPKNL